MQSMWKFEKKLRHEIEMQSHRNAELETNHSILGSEDGMNVTESDCGTSSMHIASYSHERIAFLEKGFS